MLEFLLRLRRRKSETFRAQYINTKDIKYVNISYSWKFSLQYYLTTKWDLWFLMFSLTLLLCWCRICAATWNVGGKIPPDNLDLEGLLDVNDPADIYVIG